MLLLQSLHDTAAAPNGFARAISDGAVRGCLLGQRTEPRRDLSENVEFQDVGEDGQRVGDSKYRCCEQSSQYRANDNTGYP